MSNPMSNQPDDVLENKVARILGTAILKNDKNYTDEIMAIIAEQVRLARIEEATTLGKKSVRYDKTDPIIDLDNWATPHTIIVSRIAELQKPTKETS